MHTSVFARVIYKSYSIANFVIPRTPLRERYCRIVAFTLNTDSLLLKQNRLLPYNTTVKLRSLFKLRTWSYLSLTTAEPHYNAGVITSLVSAVARQFMQGYYPDRHL
jgi:hypothetical protein